MARRYYTVTSAIQSGPIFQRRANANEIWQRHPGGAAEPPWYETLVNLCVARN
jgi:hypothetical protein